MTPEVVIPAIGGFLAALLVFLGAWNTARVAKFSNERTSRLEEFRLQLEARDKLNAEYRKDLDKVETKLNALTERFNEVQNNERMLFWWAKAVYPILVASGVPFPAPPPGVSQNA